MSLWLFSIFRDGYMRNENSKFSGRLNMSGADQSLVTGQFVNNNIIARKFKCTAEDCR